MYLINLQKRAFSYYTFKLRARTLATKFMRGTWEGKMFAAEACEALEKGLCLELTYDGFSRVVEVHAVGTSTAGNPVMRVWQVRGGSVHNEPVGWKLMRLDEANGASVTNERSQAPRPGYKPGDKGMTSIMAQL